MVKIVKYVQYLAKVYSILISIRGFY